MDLFLLRIFSGLLLFGALVWLSLEWRSLRRDQERGTPHYVRFYRRSLVSVVLTAMALMVFFGKLPSRGAALTAATMAQFHHWEIVFALTMLLMVLALWDFVDGVRSLRGYLDRVEREEVRKIQDHLRCADSRDPHDEAEKASPD